MKMNVKEYFDEVQNIISAMIQDKNLSITVEQVIGKSNKNNVQAIINQNFNKNISTEETAEHILASVNKDDADQTAPNAVQGERSLNTMERKIMRYNDFLNENKSTTYDNL